MTIKNLNHIREITWLMEKKRCTKSQPYDTIKFERKAAFSNILDMVEAVTRKLVR
jgi:hypothetical protein